MLRHENAVLRRNASQDTIRPSRPGLVRRAYPVHPAAALGRGLPGDACNAAGLAPQARRQEIRHQQAARAPTARDWTSPGWPSLGGREPAVGLPAYSRRATKLGVEHYNTARPHQGIAQRVPDPGSASRVTATDPGTCQIRRKPVLGGLINENERAA